MSITFKFENNVLIVSYPKEKYFQGDNFIQMKIFSPIKAFEDKNHIKYRENPTEGHTYEITLSDTTEDLVNVVKELIKLDSSPKAIFDSIHNCLFEAAYYNEETKAETAAILINNIFALDESCTVFNANTHFGRTAFTRQ